MSELTELDREANRRAELEHARNAVEALRSSEGWKRWLGLRRHFHRYSFANQLLIAVQKPDATRVAGFRAWLQRGYCVTRGEKALRIWVPIPPSKAAMDAWERNGAIVDERPRTRFKLGPVFDRSQVAPLPPPDVAVCTSVDELAGGTIVHTGSGRTTGNTFTGAITGGTGRYRGVTGSVVTSWQNASDAVVDYHLSWR
jgi:hypothetical protein